MSLFASQNITFLIPGFYHYMDLACDSCSQLPDLADCLDVHTESRPGQMSWDPASGAQGETWHPLPSALWQPPTMALPPTRDGRGTASRGSGVWEGAGD